MAKGKQANVSGAEIVSDITPEIEAQRDIVVTEELLDLNPELKELGVEVGEVLQVSESEDKPEDESDNDLNFENNVESAQKSFVVAETFRDATRPNEYIIFEAGSVANFEGDRLSELIEKGFVKEAE